MSKLGPTSHVVIVGAGLAGDRCAFALREAGFAGVITLIGAETVRPYDRPPLSKAVLKLEGEEEKIFFRTEQEYADAAINLMLGQTADAIDRTARTLSLENGETFPYDILVLATGSRLRQLPDLLRTAPNVHYLRDREDAVGLRAAFERGGRVAIIGGGVIGLEAASAASQRGLSVTVIEPENRLMARACGATVSKLLTRRHREAGVQIRCNNRLVSIQEKATGYLLGLFDGSTLEAEIVIVGIGVMANVELAAEAGLETSANGIVVDGQGRTGDPAIYAVGEVAFHYNALSDGYERQENWLHAAAHGDHVGRSIMGAGDGYAEIPGFWSDQYDLSLQSVGRTTAEYDVLRECNGDRIIVFHMEGQKLAGATGINAPRELRQAKALIKSDVSVDSERLADPKVKVKDAAAHLSV